MNKAREKGFTLIELLIVIAIIAVLLTILVPALQQAKKQAKNALCATNMSAWGKAVQMYAADHRDYFPHNGKDPLGDSYDFDWVSGTILKNFFPRYLFKLDQRAKEDRNNILFCPTDTFCRDHFKDDFQYCVDRGLIGYRVLFGNDKDLLLVTNGPSNYSLPQCPKALEWVTRRKVGGPHNDAPILADTLQAGSNPWNWGSVVPLSSHADPKNDNAPEGGYFLFEDGRVDWYHGVDDGHSNFGQIGIGGEQRYWYVYFALPDVR